MPKVAITLHVDLDNNYEGRFSAKNSDSCLYECLQDLFEDELSAVDSSAIAAISVITPDAGDADQALDVGILTALLESDFDEAHNALASVEGYDGSLASDDEDDDGDGSF